MPNKYFRFKQFRITQDNAAMKVGTDGTLLGAWTDCSNAKNILDVGTGTGIIALMMAQKCEANIIGIDLDDNAIIDAKDNTEASPWSNRVSIIKSSLQDYTNNRQQFDLIVSNPPFFENSLKAVGASRNMARHTDSLTFSDLIKYSCSLLTNQGRMTMIMPAENIEKLKIIAAENKLHISKLLWVKPTPKKDPKRVLIELKKTECTCQESTIIIEEFGRHQYSKDFIELTKAYYLNM